MFLLIRSTLAVDPISVECNLVLGPDVWMDGAKNPQKGPVLTSFFVHETSPVDTTITFHGRKPDGSVVDHKCTFKITDKGKVTSKAAIFVIQAIEPYFPAGEKQENVGISMDYKLAT